MKITTRFNIGMTFAVIGYGLLLSPILPDESAPTFVETIFPESVTLQIAIGILSVASAIAASMFIVKAIWNRLFPELCGWKEVNLAESYAISLFIGMFLIQ